MKLATLAITLTSALALSLVAAKAEDMNMHDMTDTASSDESKALNDAMMKMHEKMTMKMTGDADVDFVQGMIPHHEGAVDMAKIELQYGKDPELHKLAENIVKAQESEIAFMTSWLKKHSK